MPKRTIVAYRLGYYQRGLNENDRELFKLNEITRDATFGDLVRQCWTEDEFQVHEKKEISRRVTVLEPITIGRTLILKAEAGEFGEPGQIIDSSTGKLIHNDIDGTAAKMGELRIGFLTPDPDAHEAFAIVEGSRNGGNLKEPFESMMRKRVREAGKYTLHIERTLSADEWLQTQAELKKIVVRQTRPTHDEFDDVMGSQSRYTIAVQPEKGAGSFGERIKRGLLNQKIRVRDIVDIAEVEDEEVLVEMSDGKRTKLMDVNNLRSPFLLEVISKDGEPPVSDERFAQIVEEKVADLLRDSPGD